MLIYLLFIEIGIIVAALWGLMVVRRNVIVIFMVIELLFLAMNFGFIFSALLIGDLMGLVNVLYILTVAAAESAIGLAILVVHYRLNGFIILDLMSLLKG